MTRQTVALAALTVLAFVCTILFSIAVYSAGHKVGYAAAQAEFDPNLDPTVVALPACETDAECELLHAYIDQIGYRHRR